MGILDLPAPVLQWLDGLMGFAPAGWRLAFWGALAGCFSMWLYGRLSPQARIAEGKQEQRRARQALDAFDGDFADAGPLIRGLLAASLAQVGRVTVPAILGSIPVLILLVWLSNAYGHRFPAAPPTVAALPAGLTARWDQQVGRSPVIAVIDSRGVDLPPVTLAAPIPVIEKRQWWNLLIGNPAGYLPADGPIQQLRVDLPGVDVIAVGPQWLRGWEVTFFATLLVASLACKKVFKIE